MGRGRRIEGELRFAGTLSLVKAGTASRRRRFSFLGLPLGLGAFTTVVGSWFIATFIPLSGNQEAFRAERIDVGSADLVVTSQKGRGVVVWDWYVETGGFVYTDPWQPAESLPDSV